MDLSRSSDAELLAAVAAMPEAMGEIYRRRAPALYQRVLARCGDPALAADVVAEAFAQALLHAGRYRDDGGGSAAPWLYGIALHLLHRAWRRNAVDSRARRKLGLRERLETEDHAQASAERADAAARAPALRAALAQLPAGRRQAVELRVLDGLDYHEIAARLGVATATARVRVFRGLAALRVLLEQDAREAGAAPPPTALEDADA